MTKSPSDDWFGEARKLRDKGLDLVGVNNADWLMNAVRIVRTHAPAAGEFMAESFQSYPGIGQPAHPNAWGSLTNRLIRLGVIEPTGEFRQSVGRSKHAHNYRVYRRTPGSFSGRPGIPLKKIPWTEQ